MAAKESIETTSIRSANSQMIAPQVAATPAGSASIRIVVGHQRVVRVRISGKGLRGG